MTREECVKALQKSAKAEGFITMAELLRFLGMKNRACAKRYVEGCDLIDNKFYFIREVAGVIMSHKRLGGKAQ